MGFRACGASAKTGKGRRSGERDLRDQTHHKATVNPKDGLTVATIRWLAQTFQIRSAKG